jgi:hypothetical protein
MNNNVQDESEGENLYSLFVCEEYIEQCFSFGSTQQRLLCSKMCTTDYDLTGQIVWPASRVLAWYLLLHKNFFSNRSVLELGAGCGLAGFFVSNFAQNVVVTDGNGIVLRLLERNKSHLLTKNVTVSKLIWGLRKEIQPYSSSQSCPEVVIGADVILWPNQITSLLYTIRWLLLPHGHHNVAYISYVHRANSTFEQLLRQVQELGLRLDITPAHQFLPTDCIDLLSIDARILCISLLPETLANAETIMNASDEAMQQQIDQNHLPC